MERLKSSSDNSKRPSDLPIEHTNIEPADLDTYRNEAAFFLSNSLLTEKDLKKIGRKSRLSLQHIDLENGIEMTRMVFPTGSIIELFGRGRERFRIVYDANRKTAKAYPIPGA